MNAFRNWSKLALLGLVSTGFLVGPAQADDRKIIVRRQGTVVSYEVGSNQPVTVMTNRYMVAGNVETKANSIAKIGSLSGGSVLVGPETIIDVAKFDPDAPNSEAILKQGSARFRVVHKPGQEYRVRTNSSVLAARGTDFLVQVVDSYSNLPLAPTASLVPEGELMAQGGAFTLMQVFEGSVEVFGPDGTSRFGTLGPGDTLVAPAGGPANFKYNDPTFHFVGELGPVMTAPERNLRERFLSTYYLENVGPMGFYTEYLDQVGGLDVTGGPLLIAPGTESNGSLLLEILLPGGSSGSSSGQPFNPFNPSSSGGSTTPGTTGGTTGAAAGSGALGRGVDYGGGSGRGAGGGSGSGGGI